MSARAWEHPAWLPEPHCNAPTHDGWGAGDPQALPAALGPHCPVPGVRACCLPLSTSQPHVTIGRAAPLGPPSSLHLSLGAGKGTLCRQAQSSCLLGPPCENTKLSPI